MVTIAAPVRRVLSAALLVATLAGAWLLLPTLLGGRVAYVEVTGHSMDPTLSSGDLVAVRRQAHYRVGDLIAYQIRKGDFGAGRIVIHRIVGGDAEQGFLIRGDNRKTDDMWHPTPADIRGVRWFRIPAAGAVVDRVRTPMGVAAFAALLSVLAVLALVPRTTADERPAEQGDLLPVPAG